MYRGALFTTDPAPLAGAERTLDERIIVRTVGQQSNSTFDEACLADLAAQLSDEDAAKVAAEPGIAGDQLSAAGSALLTKVITDCAAS